MDMRDDLAGEWSPQAAPSWDSESAIPFDRFPVHAGTEARSRMDLTWGIFGATTAHFGVSWRINWLLKPRSSTAQ
jgi:hypothetical protein